MNRRSIQVAVLIAIASCLGCHAKKNKTETAEVSHAPAEGEKQHRGIAVIDLNRVAIATGEMKRIQASVQKKEAEYLLALKELERRFDARLEEAKSNSQEGAKSVDTIETEKKQEMLSGANTANTQLSLLQERMRQTFHSSVRPVAQRIAESHGCELVLTAAQVFSMAPDVDITDQVIGELKQQIARTAATKPKEAKRYAELPGGGSFVPR